MALNLQQSGTRPKRRALFICLLVVALALCVVYSREGEEGPLHSFQDSVMNYTGPALGVGAAIGASGDDVAQALSDLSASPSTLSALREQNEQLRRLLAETEEYRQEAERLRDLLDMRQVSGVTGPTARIIGRSTNAWDQSITIDLGSADGVRPGMTVMGATGVIGQVSRVGEHTATVRLLTDPDSGAAVMIQSSRELGIVRGSISGVLFLEDLEDDVIPQVGDVVITSGLGGSYERGLIVGAVASVNKAANNPTGAIVVNPNDNASVLEEVIVVFSAPDLTAAEAEAKAKADSADGADEAQEGEGAEGAEGVIDDAASDLGDGGEQNY